MWFTLAKYLGPALAGIAIGFQIGGWRAEAAFTDREMERARVAEKRLAKAEELHAAELAEIRQRAAEAAESYREALTDAETRAARNSQIADQYAQTADELKAQIDELEASFGDGSVCSFDDADLSLLNRAIEAANGLPREDRPTG